MPPIIESRSVAHVALEVADLDSAMHLFIQQLGFEPVGAEGYLGDRLEWLSGHDCLARATAAGLNLEMVVVALGDFRINLQKAASGPRLDHIAIAAKDQSFPEVVAAVRDAGLKVLDPYTIPGKRIMFQAAGGFVIEVYPREIYQ